MIARAALIAIAIAFVVAEIIRPTRVHEKKIASRALLLASQDAGTPRNATLDPELLQDLPRIRPNAPATIQRAPNGTFVGTIVDPYTGRPGVAVFPIVGGARIENFAAEYTDGHYIIRLNTAPPNGKSFAVGLVASDQRGYFRSAPTLVSMRP